jgi:hypothetical protein
MSAFDGLAKRLQKLSEIISNRDDLADKLQPPAILTEPEKQAWRRKEQMRLVECRNKELRQYRALALGLPFEKDEVPRRKYTTRVFSYLHNEFNFNAPRPIGRTTRVTHLVFTPLFAEKTEEEPPSKPGWEAEIYPGASQIADREMDPAKVTGSVTAATLRWLWAEAINDPAQTQNFRGGRDPYFRYVKELFDFSEPFITPKRSIAARKWLLLQPAAIAAALPEKGKFAEGIENQAISESTKIYDRIRNAGLSNRLANTVEYFRKYYRAVDETDEANRVVTEEIAHFRWTRHARAYQTLTFTHELPGFTGQSFDGAGGDPFEKTALHAFPGDIFDDGVYRGTPFGGIFGHFMQGANWLVVPVEEFFHQQAGEPGADLLTALERVTLKHDNVFAPVRHLWHKLRNRRDARTSARDVGAIFDFANTDRKIAAEVDRLVISATSGFLGKCFNDDPKNLKNEIVGIKCMDGRGYIFANVRHNSEDTNDLPKDLFTRAVIIDCGMHKFQRGRLLQSMTEFATERTMALRWIARFRLLHSALSVLEAKLNLAVSNYHNKKEQFSSNPDDEPSPLTPPVNSVVPFAYWNVLHPDVEFDPTGKYLKPHSASKERKLIIALEFLSSCLTLMNDIVEGGMADSAGGSTGSIESLRGKLKSIREAPIVGHQSLTDFIDRRFIPATRVIYRAGERYIRLRERISAVAELINANLSATEWHENQKQVRRQTALLTIAEFVGAAAFGYYGATLTIDFVGSFCEAGHWAWAARWWPGLLPPACEVGPHSPWIVDLGIKFLIYGIFVGGVVFLNAISISRLLIEWVRSRKRKKRKA